MGGKILCRALTGPTASGKSDLAVKLAQEQGWHILCMDSMQIYRGMDIGTAKPSAADRALVPHHLIDICDPWENFSVSQYVEIAEEKIRAIHSNGQNVLFVGGTGLYLEAMMKPMRMGYVPANESLRSELRELAEKPDGKFSIDALLRELDPESAGKIPMNDIRRRIRAIEVARMTGIPFSRQEPRETESPFEWITVSISMEREVLYDRINRRTECMMAAGLPQEVRRLLNNGVPENSQSMQAIGYKEIIPCLHGKYSAEAACEKIKINSRHYAKRQITFLKRLQGIQYVSAERKDLYQTVLEMMKGR